MFLRTDLVRNVFSVSTDKQQTSSCNTGQYTSGRSAKNRFILPSSFVLLDLKVRSNRIVNQNQVSHSGREYTRSPVRNGASLRQSLFVSGYNCNRSANKSNHRTQNPLFKSRKPRTRDNTLYALPCSPQRPHYISDLSLRSRLIFRVSFYNCKFIFIIRTIFTSSSI
jgi:hypothetical protein